MSKKAKISKTLESHDKTISVAFISVVRNATFAHPAGVMTELVIPLSRSHCSIPGREKIFSLQ
jgi:hypothetical protein